MNGRLDNPKGLERLAEAIQAGLDAPPMTKIERELMLRRLLYTDTSKAQGELPLESSG